MNGSPRSSDDAIRREREDIERAVAGWTVCSMFQEQVKRFAVLPRDWSPDTEELTPTLKVKRKVVREKYAAAIDALYPSSLSG